MYLLFSEQIPVIWHKNSYLRINNNNNNNNNIPVIVHANWILSR